MKTILLDTNSYSLATKGYKKVTSQIESADVVYMSSVVLGELYAGFKRGNIEGKNRAILNSFLSKSTVQVLDVTAKTAEIYAAVRYSLILKGKPIPHNDVWIAAHAMEAGATLITFDKHFLEVLGLKIFGEE
ncbi:MAG: type II toxin-antitoxin system VapC family toxin [Patescibacteria group bacterium]